LAASRRQKLKNNRARDVLSVLAAPVAQTSVSQVFNLPPAGCEQRSADCKSAIRQIKNLRYVKQIPYQVTN